jgi:hypothetical protein
MNEMHELITVEAFGRGLTVACSAWTVLWLLALAVAALRKRPNAAALGLWAGLGPIAMILWAFYSWMVRVVPETGYVGLHRVSVFAINLLVFVVVGAALGAGFSRLYARKQAEAPTADRAGKVGKANRST